MKFPNSHNGKPAKRTHKAFCIFCRSPLKHFKTWIDETVFFCPTGCDERHPEICDTCEKPCLRDEWGQWHCSAGCWGCGVCGEIFRKGHGCAECFAARDRKDGPSFCDCCAPMVPHGLPPVYVCKAGCMTCDDCGASVPFGQTCHRCRELLTPCDPDGQRMAEMNAFDDDIPY
jgi:hypothetical protein